MNSEEILTFFRQREQQCAIERRALEMWLGLLTPLRWLTVSGGIVFSAIAGATILGKHDLLVGSWPVVGGVCALTASILTGLHTGLKCESHQAECRRLIQVYLSLEAAYQAARLLPPTELALRQSALEERFEQARSNAAASAPGRYRVRAEQQQRGPGSGEK
jgi:hypothetical protein